MNYAKCNRYYSDSVWELLSDELIVEILIRLPPKTLVRFKCVSKQWYSLISDVCVPRISPLPLSGIVSIRILNRSHISAMYDQMLTDNQLDLELFEDDYLWSNLPVSLLSSFWPWGPWKLLDMCNGLCLYFRPSINFYCIWNYTTLQYVLFPPPAAPSNPSFGFEHKKQEDTKQCVSRVVFSALAFDPKQSLHFKVVRFGRSRSKRNPGVSRLNIFSSQTGEWVENFVDIGPSIGASRLVDFCVYLNQSLYRLSMSLHLLRYDLEKKVNVTVIKLPDFGSGYKANTFADLGCIGSSSGQRLYYARHEHDATKVLIWMLCYRNDASDWVFMHSITTQDLFNYQIAVERMPRYMRRNFPDKDENWGGLKLSHFVTEFLPHLRPVAFDPTSNAVILWALGITLYYHLDNNKLGVICHVHKDSYACDSDPLKVFLYSRCLVPLKDLGWNHHRQDNRAGDIFQG